MSRPSLLALLLLTACGTTPTTPSPDAGPRHDASARDAGTADAGAIDASLPDGSAPAPDGSTAFPEGAPFETALDAWEYAAVDGAVCGNGSALGVAVERTSATNDVVLFLAGGGACWDAATCFGLRSAVHIDEDVPAGTVLAEAQAAALRVFLDRDDPDNAFPDASYVYVPYCTGDLHAGTRVGTYDVFGTPRMVHHAGATNIDLVLARMRATWPDAERVWVVGVSAGGYGATLSWWRVAEAFPDADVDAFSDSGLPIAPGATRLREMRDAWAPRFPPGCADCATNRGFAALLPHYAATMPADARYGLLSYRQDGVIALYFALDGPAVERALADLRTAASDGQRTFYVDGTEHVLSGAPSLARDGTTVADFVRRFATRDATWVHIGP